ncbi:MAG: TonB-dependent receptor plug domain-containing protein [Candidatus Cloacimonadales bacterium]|nr:TonB-dependent receptor plug domain-containing protein [Candidatus Cloacimonadales bacterium]
MRRNLTILFLLLFTRIIALDVSGKVVSEDDKPLSNVVISTSEKAVVTDRYGVFFLKGIAESSQIKIHKIGFADLTLPAEKLPARIFLKKASIEVEGISVTAQSSALKLPETADKVVIKVDEQKHYRNAAEILSDRADLLVSGTGLHGETQNVAIPGFQPRHTLVMLDGIALNRSGEAFDIASIPAEIIQSIEIVKGSMGTAGGSGALGAVININTKRTTGKLAASYQHTFGSFGLDKHVVFFSGSNNFWSGYLHFSKSFSRNDFKYKGHEGWDSLSTREFNDKKIYDLNLNIVHSNKYVNANYKLIFQNYFKKLPGTIQNPDYYKNSRQTGQTFRHFLELARVMSDYNLKADLYYSVETSTYDNTRLDSPYNTLLYRDLGTTDQIIRGAKLMTEYQQQDFYFDWGGDYKFESFSYRDELNEANSISRKILDNYGIFGNTKFEKHYYPSRLALIGSARWDHNNRFRNFTSWRIASEYTYETLFDIILGGNAANSFSYPSFLSIYWKGDTQATGNPDLKPEESLSWQLFGKLDFHKHFLKITYRQDKPEDMIVWFLEYNSKWKPQNIGKAEINTWEFETEMKPAEFLTLSGMYSVIDAKNKTKSSDLYGENIIYTPRNKLNLQAKIQFENYIGMLSYNRTGEQTYTFDQLSDSQELPAYDLVNASVNYRIYWKRLQFTVGANANNIFNKLYEVYKYIPQPGFNWDVNVGVKWEM